MRVHAPTRATGRLVASILVLVGCGQTPTALGHPPHDGDVADGDGEVSSVDADVSDGEAGISYVDANIGPNDAGTTMTSIEFGRTLYGHDFATRADAPTGGTLFSVWTKVPDATPSVYPWARGNMDVYVLYGPGWHMRCLTGNLSASSPSSIYYNANAMLFAGDLGTWVDDYAVYFAMPPNGAARAFGWVWAAWQVVVEPDRFTVRQWLKFGIDGLVFAAGEDHPTFASMRDRLVADRGWTRAAADAWVPGDATHFQVGSDNGYLVRARMTASHDAPSLAVLEMVARATAPDASAWAAYDLDWVDGGADLGDRSGHGRNLSLDTGGALYPGVPSPAF